MRKFAFLMFMFGLIHMAPCYAGDEDVSKSLDDYAREHALPAANIIAPAAPRKEIFRKPHEFQMGVERYGYEYKETVDGQQFMKTKGAYNGLFLAYTFRPMDVDSIVEAVISMLRAEFRYASGSVDYTGSGSWNGIKDYVYEVRGIVGRDFDVGSLVRLTPYAGMGMRYLNNGFQALPARMVNGQPTYSGYNRESTYYYVPVGVDAYRELPGSWALGANFEYDYWYSGNQISHFEDEQLMDGTNAGYDPMKNRQPKGYGWRASLKVVKQWPRVKLSLEPYYRFWHVQDSNIEFMTKAGQKVPVPGFPGYYEAGLEPNNTTHEVGVKMGVQF